MDFRVDPRLGAGELHLGDEDMGGAEGGVGVGGAGEMMAWRHEQSDVSGAAPRAVRCQWRCATAGRHTAAAEEPPPGCN